MVTPPPVQWSSPSGRGGAGLQAGVEQVFSAGWSRPSVLRQATLAYNGL
jgi:hypothetical protein